MLSNASSACMLSHLVVALVLFLDGLGGSAGGSVDVFGDEEVLFLVVLLGLLVLRSGPSSLIIVLHESHLLMVGWGEHLLVLGLFGQFRREDLRFDVGVGLDV